MENGVEIGVENSPALPPRVAVLEERMDRQERLRASEARELSELAQWMRGSDRLLKSMAAVQSDHGLKLTALATTLDGHTAILNEHTALLNDHSFKLNQLDTKMDRLDTKVKRLDTKFDRLDTKFDRLDTKFDRLETHVAGLESMMTTRLSTLEGMLTTLIERPTSQ